ncbi:MAG: hypothetical protein AAGE52_16035 [Myxococcota bacterium]
MDRWFESADLPDGSRVGLAGTKGKSVRLVRVHPAGDVHEFAVPHLQGNLGGGKIIVSPSARVAVLSCYSGQSEQAYDTFDLQDGGLAHRGGLSWTVGMGAYFAFSDDEDRLLMGCPATCMNWWEGWWSAELVPGDESKSEFYFGTLVDHDLAAAHLSISEVWVRGANEWEPAETPGPTVLRPVLHHQAAELELPFGRVRDELPFPARIIVNVT